MDKNKQKIVRNKPIIALYCIFLIVIMLNLIVISGANWDNQKHFDKDIGKYGMIEIRNSFLGIPWFELGKVATLELKENTDSCGSSCSAETEIIMYEKGVLIDKVRFMNKDKISKTSINSYQFYIQDGTKQVEVDDYEYQCDISYAKNGSIIKDCNNFKTGSHFINEPIWIEYNLGDKVEKGTYQVKLEGKKHPLQTVDWQITSQGKLISEWALWSATLTDSLVGYWNFDEGSGTNVEEVVYGINNGTFGDLSETEVSWVTGGLLGGAINSTGHLTGNIDIGINDSLNSPETNELSFSIWVKVNDTQSDSSGLIYSVGEWNFYLGADPTWQISGAKTSVDLSNNEEWQHIVVVFYEGVNVTIYINNTAYFSIDTATFPESNGHLYFGGNTSTNFVGLIDEVGFWDRALDVDDVNDLYNDGLGITFANFVSVLNFPDDNYISPLENVAFNCSALIDSSLLLTNISLWHNGTGTWDRILINKTLGGFNETILETSIVDETIWNCEVCNSDNVCVFSNNRTVDADFTSPLITINAPTGTLDVGYAGGNETLNWSLIDKYFDSVWYEYNGTNTTVYGLENQTTFALETGNYDLTLWANDSLGNFDGTITSWDYEIFVNSETYTTPVIEGSEQDFNVNVTITQLTLTPSLIYDGISYLGTCDQNVNEFYCSRTLDIPTVTEDTNVSFFWSFLMADANVINISENNITVNNFEIDNCTLYDVEIINLLLKDEAGNTLLTGETRDIEIEVDIFSLDNVLIGEYNKQWLNQSNVSVCIGNLTGIEYDLYTTINFVQENYVNEFYFIDKKRINSTEVPITINLMDLLSVDSTSFLFNFFDVDGLIVTNPIIHTWRKYIGEGLFREVERSKQNEDGNTIIHLVEEDVIYYFQVSQDDVVIFTSETYTALCDTTPCTIILEESGGFQDFTNDWDLIEGGGYIMIADSISRTVNLTFSTTTPSTFNLTVYRLDDTGEYEDIGSDQSTGTTGTITVDVPNANGNISFFGVVRQNGDFKTSRWIEFSEQASVYFGTGFAVFLGILIILCLGLMAISEGSGTIIFVILGMILTVILGLIDLGIESGVGFGLIIYFVITGGIIIGKLTRRNR